MPVKNLFSAISSSTPIVASSQSSIVFKDVALFEELISSRLFRQYELLQGALENSDVSLEQALDSLRLGSHRLVAQRPRLLRTKRVAISLLPVSAQVIDTVFGKLPGSLAEFFVNALSTWLQDERRVIIYQFDDLLKATMESRMNDLIKAKYPLGPG